MLRFLTCGSVDDGKSTLLGRLLHELGSIPEDTARAIEADSRQFGTQGVAPDYALLLDGLQAEREQGITIDAAYRYFSNARRRFIVADAPGHEQYTRNMATGASTADATVVLIDASKGVLVQSRRHAYIASLLRVRHVVVAVNKMDLVDFSEEAFARIVRDFVAFAERSGIEDVRFVPISALDGDMIVDRGDRLSWYDGPTLLQILETAEVSRDLAQAPFRFPIQLVARPTEGRPRGYMGRIESGSVAVGDAVTVLPSGITTRIRAIETFDGPQAAAGLHASVTVVLDDEIDISRGDMLVHADAPPAVARSLSATLCWLGDAPLDPRRRYLLRHTTREVRAHVERIDDLWNISTQRHEPALATLARNDIGRIALKLAQPVFAEPYRVNHSTGSFILIDETTNNTVAAGMIQ